MAFGRKRVPDFMCMCWLLFFFSPCFLLFIQGFVFIVRRVILAYQRDTLWAGQNIHRTDPLAESAYGETIVYVRCRS